jgi:drug/metabolite transporter (DMT)-like permease
MPTPRWRRRRGSRPSLGYSPIQAVVSISTGKAGSRRSVSRSRIYKLQLWFAFFSNYVFYGANYLAISETVRHGLPTVTNGGVRYFFAGVVTLAVMAARKRSIRLSRAHLLSTMLCGLLCLGVFGFVAVAEKHVSSGLAALLLASVPLLVIGMRIGVDRERLSIGIIASVCIGFAGVATVVVSQGGGTGGSVGGMALIMITALGLASGTFLIPKLSTPADPIVSGAWQLLWGGLALLITGAALGEWSRFHIDSVTVNAWLAFAYLMSFGTFATYLSFVWLLRQVPVSQVAASGYVNPIVAVVLGWALAGEQLTPISLIGGAVIVVSVAFVIARDRSPMVEVAPPGAGPAAKPVPNPGVDPPGGPAVAANK